MSALGILVTKEIFADIPAGAAGTSAVVDLLGSTAGCVNAGGVSHDMSIQAVYDVQSPTAKTFDSGGAEVDTATFDTLANTDPGDYMVVYDTAGLAWAIGLDTTGTDPEPTGDVWVSIPAARKAFVDVSGATTGADIAALVETAFNALVDVPITAADSTADVAFTGDLYGVVDAPEVHNADDSGAGSITIAVTDAGVASEVDVDENSVTIPSHGYATGLVGQLTATGTLPAGLSLLTNYYIIAVDANTVKFASSQANALAGTAVNITDQGSDENVSTFTATALSGASITYQLSNDNVDWTNLTTATSITVDGSEFKREVVNFRYFRAVKALTAGQVDLSATVIATGPCP